MSQIITPKGLKIELTSKIEGTFTPKTIIESIKITQVNSNRSSIFMNCVLLEYDTQLLIYQKRLFSKKCSLRFKIIFDEHNESAILNLKKSFFKGFLSFSIYKKDISCLLKTEGYFYKIQLPKNSWLTANQYLKFTLPNKIFK